MVQIGSGLSAMTPLDPDRVAKKEHSGDPGVARCSAPAARRDEGCRNSDDFFVVKCLKTAINCLILEKKRRFRIRLTSACRVIEAPDGLLCEIRRVAESRSRKALTSCEGTANSGSYAAQENSYGALVIFCSQSFAGRRGVRTDGRRVRVNGGRIQRTGRAKAGPDKSKVRSDRGTRGTVCGSGRWSAVDKSCPKGCSRRSCAGL